MFAGKRSPRADAVHGKGSDAPHSVAQSRPLEPPQASSSFISLPYHPPTLPLVPEIELPAQKNNAGTQQTSASAAWLSLQSHRSFLLLPISEQRFGIGRQLILSVLRSLTNPSETSGSCAPCVTADCPGRSRPAKGRWYVAAADIKRSCWNNNWYGSDTDFSGAARVNRDAPKRRAEASAGRRRPLAVMLEVDRRSRRLSSRLPRRRKSASQILRF
jgi:hypothetical protein